MSENLNDKTGWIAELKQQLARLKSGAFLENASISDGLLLLIRATLRLEGGALLEGDGIFRWRGPGSIAGNFEVLEGGVIKVGGVLISPIGGGRIMIGAGPNGIILDGATGSLTNGNVTIEGGKATFGVGDQKVVIDGATGKVQSGKLSIDPTANGGSIKFADGPEVFADGTTLALYSIGTGAYVEVGAEELKVRGPGLQGLTVDARGIKPYVPTRASTEGLAGWYGEDTDGYMIKLPPGVGGPGSGSFDWPFPIATKTYGFRPPDRPTHDGVDLAGPQVTGQLIPSAARGVVTYAGGNPDTGFGYYVIVSHGSIGGADVETLYAHMATLPLVSVGQTVAKGAPLGPVGDTGRSEGDHLHFEVHLDGTPVDPEPWMAAHGA